MKVKTEKNVLSNTLVSQKNNIDIIPIVEKKCKFFQEIIQKTLIHINKNKRLDILGISDVGICINNLNIINNKTLQLMLNIKTMNKDEITNSLQTINNDLSILFKTYGTESLDDLLSICFGNNSNIITQDDDQDKYELLKKYFHPTSYKIISYMNKKDVKSVTIIDDDYNEKVKNLECQDISLNYKQFHIKVYGIKMYLYHSTLESGYLVPCHDSPG
jgi:hypothetical protein